MRFIRAISVIFLLASPCLAAEINQVILVDRSGSMKAYYEKGIVNDLVGKIHGLLGAQGKVELVAFSDNVRPVREFNELVKLPWGAFTYLDKAIDSVIGRTYSTVWMITDNIQDQPGAPEAGNTDVFYQKLRGEAVKKVVIFPIVQPSGVSGIAIYAMHLSPDFSDVFDKQIRQFLESVKGAYNTEALRMKPLDRDTVELTFVRGKLQPGKSSVSYKEGQEIRETLDLKFKSRFEHLKIVNAEVEVAQTKAQFGPTSLLTSEKKNLTITPIAIPNLDPQGETKQVYTVSIDLGKIKLRRDLASLWKAAWSKPTENVGLNLSIVIQVPRSNFRFNDSFLRKYGADGLKEANSTGRVYGIKNLPTLLAEETTAIVAESPLSFQIEYPWWPPLVFILMGLLLVLTLFLLARLLLKFLGTGEVWEATMTSPSQAKGKIQGGWLSVPFGGIVVQIGRIKGQRFFPAAGISPKAPQPLKEGTPLALVYHNQPLSLIFRKLKPQVKTKERRPNGRGHQIKI